MCRLESTARLAPRRASPNRAGAQPQRQEPALRPFPAIHRALRKDQVERVSGPSLTGMCIGSDHYIGVRPEDGILVFVRRPEPLREASVPARGARRVNRLPLAFLR